MNKDEIKKLARLSRIDLTSEEEARFQNEFGAILGYVDQVQSISTTEGKSPVGLTKNVMREDEGAHEAGIFTETILNQAPDRDNNYLKVKKILNND